jgi:hypothetical protein
MVVRESGSQVGRGFAVFRGRERFIVYGRYIFFLCNIPES